MARISFVCAVSGLHAYAVLQSTSISFYNAQLCHLNHILNHLKKGVSKIVFLFCDSKLCVKFILKHRELSVGILRGSVTV